MNTQKEQVIEVMRQNGGYATLEDLNRLINFFFPENEEPTSKHNKNCTGK
ncbi:MAG: hypothetical protein LBU51_04275 [Bacteroidales bacterium]|jgi:hypothetical protein|nr:hypothetical protein [Bacteroidales bacterium]